MSNSRTDQVVLVTGVSSGIGLALLELLVLSSYRVVATCRASSISGLRDKGFLDNQRFILRTLDVTDKTNRASVISEVNELWGGVDILINNAGVAWRSVMEEFSDAELHAQLEVNFFGPLALARAVMPHMRAQRCGTIINVSSVGGMMAMPTMGGYSASKFALEGASEALWYEAKPWGVSVVLIQPGFVHSRSFEHVRLSARAEISLNNAGPYQKYYQCMGDFITKMMGKAWQTPQGVARLILKTATSENPPLRVPATLDARVFGILRRFLPRSLYHKLLYSQLPCIKEWGPNAH